MHVERFYRYKTTGSLIQDDIALIRLADNANFLGIHSIKPAQSNQTFRVGTTAVMAGWGDNGLFMPRRLLKGSAQIRNAKVCKNVFGQFYHPERYIIRCERLL